METQSQTCSGERRRLPDRRSRSTSLWYALRRRGRRRSFRRADEGHRAYVDCPTPRVVLLVCIVVVGSTLDALCTMLHVAQGGREGNPLMALALAHGPITFVVLKFSFTNAGAWFLAAHQQFPLAYAGLHSLAVLYLALLGLHGILQFV